jgi:hypothetical protein
MVEETARVTHADPNLVAVQVLAMISAALGKGAVSKCGGRITFPNLYILGIADTGTGKSESAKRLCGPFSEIGSEKFKMWQDEIQPRAKANLRSIERELREIDKKSGKTGSQEIERMENLFQEKAAWEAKNTPPKLLVEDATQEALACAFLSFDQALFSFSTDAGKVISNLFGRYAKGSGSGVEREDTIYLKAYSVEPLQIDRVSRPCSMVEEPCLTVLWLIQGSKIPLLYGDAALTDGGLIPRMMPYYARKGLPILSFQPDIPSSVRAAWRALIQALFNLREKAGGVSHKHRPVFSVSTDAAEACMAWDNRSRSETQEGGLCDVSAYVSRWGEWAQRIAVNLQAAQFIHDARQDEITASTMELSIEIASWFANEQLRILHEGRIKAREEEIEKQSQRAEKLEGFLEEMQGEKTIRDLERRNGFTSKEIHTLASRFPERFFIHEKKTATKPYTVCSLR